jgi:hypothetical protein
MLVYLEDCLKQMAADPGVDLPAETDPVDADALAAAALRLFPGDDETHVNARRQLRPVSYEADAVDAAWAPEVHWRWQSPAFHSVVRALLLSHLRLRKTLVAEGMATHLGCLPHDVMLLIASQLGESWVEARPLTLTSNHRRKRDMPDAFWDDSIPGWG